MRQRARLLTSMLAAVLIVPTFLGLRVNAAETVKGDIGLYVIVYGNAIDRAEANGYASGTNAWLRKQGIPRDRVDLTVAGFTSRSGTLATGCNVATALREALNAQDRAAIERLQTEHTYVVPIVVAPNRDGCWFAGEAFLGDPGILLVTGGLRPSERLRVFRHELGHNLGLGHFSSAALEGKAPQLLRPSGSFRADEYGDPLSIMGRGTGLTFTDRFLLGSLAPAAGLLATPQQDTYVLRAKGKRDRLLAIPSRNQVRVTLEYSPSRGVEARALYETGSVLWRADGVGLRAGATAKIAEVSMQVLKSGRTSATVRLTWPQDTDAPTLGKGQWGQDPWNGLEDALGDRNNSWVSLSRVDAPVLLDHTTVPTYVDLMRDDDYVANLLPHINDAGWVASATLIVNDDTVYHSVTTNRTLAPAGTLADANGQPVPVGFLQRLPLHPGRNSLSYIVADASGNQSEFHYTFELRRFR